MNRLYVGIDVQIKRDCSFAVLDSGGTLVNSGWFRSPAQISRILQESATGRELMIGIDAPRTALKKPREHYWDGSKRSWRRRRPSDRGLGRHCEVVIKAHNIANPQWSPIEGNEPEWMRLGFALFESLQKIGHVYEAFPSASYRLLHNVTAPKVSIDFSQFLPGPKDMLDAITAAVTVKEFAGGRGAAVGGGDALGTIILPRPLQDPIPEVLTWPLD